MKVGAGATSAITLALNSHVYGKALKLIGGKGVSSIAGLVQEAVTPEQIALYAEVTGILDQTATAAVQYREVGDSSWNDSTPLWRIRPEFAGSGTPRPIVDAFAGTIFGLEPNARYEVRVIFTEGAARDVREDVFPTRAETPERGPATIFVSTESELKAAANNAKPGDVLQMTQSIELTGSVAFWRSGTQQQPCYLCGMGRDETVLSTTVSNKILHLTDNSWWVFEDFTIQGLGIDAGLGAQSQAARFWNGSAGQTGNTFRRLKITGVDSGIIASNSVYDTVIRDCIFEGNNAWTQAGVDSNLSWNDDGIRVPGIGNVVHNCDISGFGDSCALMAGAFSSAVFFYRNKIRNSCDDAIEAEYGTRNYAFYDNHITNCGNALSVDGVHGGPFYYFRNRAINVARYPVKCGARSTGVLIWANTIVATEGILRSPAGFWYWSVSANMRGWEYRNNILIFEGELAKMLRFDWGRQNWTPWKCDHNAWGRNGQLMDYTNVANGTGDLATVHAALAPIHDNDIELPGQSAVFAAPAILGADYFSEVKEDYSLELSATSEALGAGAFIPGISTSGDMGAVGYGEQPPVIGNQFEPTVPPIVPISPGALAALSASLSEGQSVPYPEGNLGSMSPNWNRSVFAWQAHFHFDSTRNEVSVLGLEHGGELLHAVLNLATDEWREVAFPQPIKRAGHVYGHNADDGKGNLIFFRYNNAVLIGYIRTVDSWDLSYSSAAPKTTTLLGGHAFHPNIGANGASIVLEDTEIFLWDRAADTWEKLTDKPYGDFYGQGIFVPGWNAVIIGGDILYRVGADKTVTVLGTPPHRLHAGSLASHELASIHIHPSDDSTVIILEHDNSFSSQGKWWASSDGIHWTLKGNGHPLKAIGQSGWTGCSIPKFGIIWGLGGDDSNAANSSVIWKPGL